MCGNIGDYVDQLFVHANIPYRRSLCVATSLKAETTVHAVYEPCNHCETVVVEWRGWGPAAAISCSDSISVQEIVHRKCSSFALQYLLVMMRPHMHILHIQVVHPCTATHELGLVHSTAVNQQLQLFTIVLCSLQLFVHCSCLFIAAICSLQLFVPCSCSFIASVCLLQLFVQCCLLVNMVCCSCKHQKPI